MTDSPSSARRPLLLRCYLIADKAMRLALRTVEAIHRGFWLGLLDRHALDLATMAMYSRSASYRDDDYNLSGFSYWQEALVDRYFAAAGRVLVTAAGGGREMIALCRRGIPADGIESEPGFVAAGQDLLRRLQFDVTLRLAPPSSVPEDVGCYDGALVGWIAYTHIASREGRESYLRELVAHLRPGSPVMLSFFPRSGADRALRLTYAVARCTELLRFRWRSVHCGDTLADGYYHFFDEADLRMELAAAGLDIVHYSNHPSGAAVALVAPGFASDG